MTSAVNSASYQKVIAQANQAFNQIFYGTLLSEFRRATPSSMLGGGMAGDCFNQMFDAHLIERLNGKTQTPLARALTKKYHLDRAGRTAPVTNLSKPVTNKG
jgi:hypothetical protein